MIPVTPRAQGFGEILDNGFTLYRRNFATFFGIAFLPRIPEVLWWIAVTALAPAWLAGPAMVLVLPWVFFVNFLILGALSQAAARAWEGEDPGIRESLTGGLRCWVAVAVAGVLTYVAVFFGILFLILPGLFLFASLFAFAPVAAIEGGGPMNALSRSWELARGGRLRILGVSIVAYLVFLIPTASVGVLAALVIGPTAFLSDDPSAAGEAAVWVEGMMQVAGPVIMALTWPFLATVIVLLYLDRRARVDASGLEDAAARLDLGG
jgi:hypothetical protein